MGAAVLYILDALCEGNKSSVTYSHIIACVRFWFSPVFILISNLRLDPWVRNTVTNGIDVGVNFAGYFFFLVGGASAYS